MSDTDVQVRTDGDVTSSLAVATNGELSDARTGTTLGRTLGVFRAFPESGAEASPALAELLSAALSAAVRNVLLYRSLVQTIEEVAAARREGRAEA